LRPVTCVCVLLYGVISSFAPSSPRGQCFTRQSAESQSPQLIPRTREERERIYQNLHRIFLNVEVSDSAGKTVSHLNQSDFTLLQNGQVQKIASFRRSVEQSSREQERAIVVVDSVNNSSSKVTLFRKEITKYLKDGTGLLANPLSIALLSDLGLRFGAPSRDRIALIRTLDELTGKVHTTSCADTIPALVCSIGSVSSSGPCDPNPRLQCLNGLFNSSITALTSLAQEQVDKPGRVIVIWLGRGWPLLNERGFVPDTADVKESFFRNLVTVSNALTEAQITLDAVASSDPLPVSPERVRDSFFYRGAQDDKHVTAASLSLQALAYQSGGLVSTSPKNIASQISRCMADSANYYQLSFDTPPSNNFGEYHSIELKLDRPDLTARTRTLYYAEQ
jgi:VWFA-related protein